MDTSMKKKIKVVNNQKLECSGKVTFTAKYKGRSTIVSALVSSSIQDEILLSLKALVELGVILDSFPHVEARAAGASVSNPMMLEMALASVKTMIGTFDDVCGAPERIPPNVAWNGQNNTQGLYNIVY